MNFFKKALVATAIISTCGVANAADVTNAVTKTSVQGLQIGAVADSSVRVIVRELLEAGDKITLVFGTKMFTTAPTGVLFASSATPTTANINITYGSGTFTMGNAVVTTANNVTTVVFEVLTGDPVPKDGSFEVGVFGTDVDKTKASDATVTYSVESGITGNAKDLMGTNKGSFIVTADQYGSSVKTGLNGVITRTTQTTFLSGGNAGASAAVEADELTIKLTDNQLLLSPAVGTGVTATVTVYGDFDNDSALVTNTGVVANVAFSNYQKATDKKSFSFDLTPSAANGIAGEYKFLIDNALAGTDKIKASDFTVSVSVDADNAVTTNTAQETLTKADAGKWIIDATIINVPYFPVGYAGTSSSVHFSNTSSSKADVIVEAVSVIDAAGKSVVYKAQDIGFDLAADSVTKVSQTVLMDLFGIPTGGTKLSVTFNIDAKNDDVSAYAFTKSADGRTEISNSQAKK